MSLSQITIIFFDAAGTLFHVKGSVGEIYARLAHEHSKDVTVQDLEAGFRRCFANAPPMAFPNAAAEHIPQLEKQWWHDLVHLVFALLGPFPRFTAYFDALYDFFAQADAWQLYPETTETLTALQGRGFRLGVISNFDSRLFGLLDGLGIKHFFDPIVISTQAGSAKPEVEIFLQALSVDDFAPHQALHIGDSFDMDIVGAKAAGLTPVHVDRMSGRPNKTAPFTVSRLDELLALVVTPPSA